MVLIRRPFSRACASAHTRTDTHPCIRPLASSMHEFMHTHTLIAYIRTHFTVRSTLFRALWMSVEEDDTTHIPNIAQALGGLKSQYKQVTETRTRTRTRTYSRSRRENRNEDDDAHGLLAQMIGGANTRTGGENENDHAHDDVYCDSEATRSNTNTNSTRTGSSTSRGSGSGGSRRKEGRKGARMGAAEDWQDKPVDAAGRSPLARAVQEKKSLALITALLDAGSNPNHVDSLGRTLPTFPLYCYA